MKPYQHIFFDLDHTLWDFDRNSTETLKELFETYKLKNLGIDRFEDFLAAYKVVNDEKWDLYRKNKISKEDLRATRFYDTLLRFEINHAKMAAEIDRDYLAKSPYKTHLFPNTIEVLGYLSEKYKLHIITNGFTEVQDIKLLKSGLKPFFHQRITSEIAGINKPDAGIFRFALQAAAAKRKNSLMVGDNLQVDILGARKVGIDQVFFNPEKNKHQEKVTFEVDALEKLRLFL